MTHYCYPQTSNLKCQNWLLKHSLNSTLTFFFSDGRPKNFYSKTNNRYISILRFCSRRITKISARQFLRDHFARTWAAQFKSLGTQLYFTLCERAFNLNVSEIIVEILEGTLESSSCSASMHTFESLSINAWLMLWLITCWEAQLIASASASAGTGIFSFYPLGIGKNQFPSPISCDNSYKGFVWSYSCITVNFNDFMVWACPFPCLLRNWRQLRWRRSSQMLLETPHILVNYMSNHNCASHSDKFIRSVTNSGTSTNSICWEILDKLEELF